MSSVPFIFECSAIEAKINNVNNVIMICIYRPSSNVAAGIYNILRTLKKGSCEYIISGDFDIDISSKSKVVERINESIIEAFVES